MGTAEAHRLDGRVAALFADALARDVAHHVVGVAGDPDGGLARELLLQPQGIVDARLAADRGEHEVVTEVDDLHGARITRGKRFPRVELGEESLRVFGFALVLGVEALPEFLSRRDRRVFEEHFVISGAQRAADRARRHGKRGLDGVGESASVLLRHLDRYLASGYGFWSPPQPIMNNASVPGWLPWTNSCA